LRDAEQSAAELTSERVGIAAVEPLSVRNPTTSVNQLVRKGHALSHEHNDAAVGNTAISAEAYLRQYRRHSMIIVETSIGTSAAAQVLGVSQRQVTYWLHNGLLDGYRTPAGWIIDPESVDRVAESREGRIKHVGRGRRAA
jgi:hypothetical protein